MIKAKSYMNELTQSEIEKYLYIVDKTGIIHIPTDITIINDTNYEQLANQIYGFDKSY